MAVYPQVLAEVKRLQSLHTKASVKATGHSLGGALAQLTAMHLIADGIPTTMINFGQPRTGDKKYASFSMTKLPQFRVVHNKDPVPHMPGEFDGYHHSAYEVYEDDKSHTVQVCDSTGEDSKCSNKWHSWDYSVSDHLVYLGLCMGSDCGSCPAKAYNDADVETDNDFDAQIDNEY